jgi:hypothetical protein
MERSCGQMDPKTKIKSPKMTPEERLAYLKSLPLWRFIEKKLNQLIDNQDLELTTFPDAVISYLVDEIDKNKTKLFTKTEHHDQPQRTK